MKVAHGIGNPRIIYLDNATPIDIGVASEVEGHYIKVSSGITLTDSLVNTALYGVNEDDKDTWARITSVDAVKKRIYHTTFSNLLPATGSLLKSKYTVYDLPYSQGMMVEDFQPQSITHRLKKGEEIIKIKGWWYSVVLDYSKKAKPELLNCFQKLYTIDRNYDVRLYPRSDNYSIYYTVNLDPEESVRLANRPFGNGHKLFQVALRGKNRLSQVQLTPTKFGIATESGALLSTEDGTIIEY